MSGSRIAFLLVGLWMVVQILSFWLPSGIEGPRNLDTGFQRLDVWFRWQLAALVIAFVAAISGFFAKPKSWRIRMIGLLPAALTLLAVVALYLSVLIFDGRPGPAASPERPTTAPAAPVPKDG